MKFSLLQTNLLGGLTKTGRVVSSKTTLPILQNILIDTTKESVCIAGTNMETTVITKVGAKIEDIGGVCVPAKLFIEFITSLPESKIEIFTKEGALVIKSEGYEAEIPCIAKEEFPPLPELGKKKAAKLNKEAFLKTMESVLYAAATDEGRPVLTGVKVKKTEDGWTTVATDGYRLSLKTMKSSFGEDTEFIIPARTLQEVVKAGEEDKTSEEILFTKTEDSQLGFIVGETEIFGRAIDGEYPNYEKILPKQHTSRATLNTSEFLSAVKSAAIFARDNANIIKMSVNKNGIVVSANTPQVGQNKIHIDATTEGEGGEIAFNSRFLIDFLAHYKEEKLIFDMTGSLNPGSFHSQEDEYGLHIIMPVRTTP